jgi:hypothetical protein
VVVFCKFKLYSAAVVIGGLKNICKAQLLGYQSICVMYFGEDIKGAEGERLVRMLAGVNV